MCPYLFWTPVLSSRQTVSFWAYLETYPSFAAPANEGAHEADLQAIGERGQDWQTKFGKTSDMEIYCYRLALEWGRLWQRGEHVGTF